MEIDSRHLFVEETNLSGEELDKAIEISISLLRQTRRDKGEPDYSEIDTYGPHDRTADLDLILRHPLVLHPATKPRDIIQRWTEIPDNFYGPYFLWAAHQVTDMDDESLQHEATLARAKRTIVVPDQFPVDAETNHGSHTLTMTINHEFSFADTDSSMDNETKYVIDKVADRTLAANGNKGSVLQFEHGRCSCMKGGSEACSSHGNNKRLHGHIHSVWIPDDIDTEQLTGIIDEELYQRRLGRGVMFEDGVIMPNAHDVVDYSEGRIPTGNTKFEIIGDQVTVERIQEDNQNQFPNGLDYPASARTIQESKLIDERLVAFDNHDLGRYVWMRAVGKASLELLINMPVGDSKMLGRRVAQVAIFGDTESQAWNRYIDEATKRQGMVRTWYNLSPAFAELDSIVARDKEEGLDAHGLRPLVGSAS